MGRIFCIIGIVWWCFSCSEKISDKDVNLNESNENVIQNDSGGDFNLKNIALLPCENNIRSTSTNSMNYIKFLALNDSTLKVEYRFYMNCCCEDIEDIKIEINSKKNTITINITDRDCGCNCICPRIVCFEIANLQENNNYEFVFLRRNLEFYTCELLFTQQVNCEIQL